MSRHRNAADRLWAGSGILLGCCQQGIGAWVKEGESSPDRAFRVAFLVGGTVVGWLLLRAAPSLLWAVTVLWCWKAWKAGPVLVASAAQKPDAEAPELAVPEVSPEAFLTLLDEAIGGHRGVYLKTLAGVLSEQYPGPWDIAAVKALCKAVGVVVTPTVRAPGGGPTVGVYREGNPLLASTPAQEPPVVVVVAGQEPTTAPTTPATTAPTTPTERVLGGYRVRAVDDPKNPARTSVTVTKERSTR